MQLEAIRDRERLAAVARTRLLDSPPDEAFDRLTRLATKMLHAPSAGLTLIDDRRVFFKSAMALPEAFGSGRAVPLTRSFCPRVVAEGKRLIVGNAPESEQWRNHAASRETGIVAYAGIPILSGDGLHVIGTFCVMDVAPHRWDEQEISGFEDLAATAQAFIPRTRAEREAAAGDVEWALRESEERHRLLTRATGDTLIEWVVDSGLLRWDGAGPRMLRYTPEEVGASIGWFYEQIHSDDRESVVREQDALLLGLDSYWSGEYRFRRGNGQYVWLLQRAFVLRDDRGHPLRVIGSLTDVTKRKQVEEAQRFLAEASTLLDGSLDYETTLAGLARLAVPTRADYCLVDLLQDGNAIRRVATAHADPVRGARLRSEEIVRLDADPEHHPVLKVIRTGVAELVSDCTPEVLDRIAHDAEHRAGLEELGLCSFMIVPLAARSGILGAITLAFSDSGRHYQPVDLVVAEELGRRAATAIEHARLYRDVQQAVRDRDEVLGFVSHDLRNPLNTIYTAASFLMDVEEERRSENRHWLETIKLASEQMNGLIEELFEVTRMQGGAFRVDPACLEVSELANAASGLMAPLARSAGLAFECAVEPDLPPLWIDRDQVLRVLSNLLGNAIKFTPTGGRIALRVAAEGSPPEGVRFAVRDSGPGLDEAELAHVFDHFWQGRQGDRRGAGMGLTIARGLVEAHGGLIRAGNADGGGAEFSFTLPVKGDREAAAEPPCNVS
jgi:PAS domain S-box-containing protein